jgi:hypothetical protein
LGCGPLVLQTGPVAEQLRVRQIDGDEGRRLVRIVRRGSGSVVTWRRAQMVLVSAQGMDAAAIAKVAFTNEDRVRDVIRNSARMTGTPRGEWPYAGRPVPESGSSCGAPHPPGTCSQIQEAAPGLLGSGGGLRFHMDFGYLQAPRFLWAGPTITSDRMGCLRRKRP